MDLVLAFACGVFTGVFIGIFLVIYLVNGK